MLRHKAMIQCARLAFGFVGIYDQDEAERITEPEAPAAKPIVKRKMSDSKIEAAIQAIKNNEYTLAQIIDAHDLTDEQLARFNSELNIIEGEVNEPV